MPIKTVFQKNRDMIWSYLIKAMAVPCLFCVAVTAPAQTEPEQTELKQSEPKQSEPQTTEQTGHQLPVPLTLDKLMALPLSGVDVLQANAKLQLQQAQLNSVAAEDDSRWSINLNPRYVEPSELSPNQSQNDSRASILFSTSIYDFGRQHNAELSGQNQLEAERINNAIAKNQYRYELMKAYFQIVLADLTFLRDNEAMSVAFVRLDRLLAKKKLEQVNDLDIAKQRQTYHQERIRYYQSRSRQRTSRSNLAVLLNRPDQLVAEIPDPPLLRKRKVPEFEPTMEKMLAQNPSLKLLKKRVQASIHQVQQARSGRWPQLTLDAGYYEYQRELPNQNKWQIGLTVQVPLWQGGRVSSAVDQALALQQYQQLELNKSELQLRQQIDELLEHIRYLAVAREQASQLMEYRDLNLDLARTRYEQELQSDLGDAMVQVSDAKLQLMTVETERILAWAKYQALLGMPVYPIVEAADQQEQSNE